MSNITPQLNASLAPHKTHCALHPRTRASTSDEFLKEAYRIAAHIQSFRTYLLSIRQTYLSTAPPGPRARGNKSHPASHAHSSSSLHLTNPDRDSIDANAKTVLRDLTASLRQLTEAESLRRQARQTIQAKKYKKSFLGSWAAGDEANQGKSEAQLREDAEEDVVVGVREDAEEDVVVGVRESVLWWLGRRLEQVAEVQRGMVERRVKREVERGRSVLYMVKGGQGPAPAVEGEGEAGMSGSIGGGGMRAGVDGGKGGQGKAALEDDERRRAIEEQLSPDQLQLFARENQDMLKHYEDTLDQVRTAEASMLEISELQTQLVQNLDVQSANISQLVSDSVNTAENVGGGNKELKRASERKSTARMVFWASCGLCGVLVGWDLIF